LDGLSEGKGLGPLIGFPNCSGIFPEKSIVRGQDSTLFPGKETTPDSQKLSGAWYFVNGVLLYDY